jgi:RNA polymerase sigma factor (sigma-70 family)
VNAFLNQRRKNDPLAVNKRSDSDPEASAPAAGYRSNIVSARTTENRLLVQEVIQFLDSVPSRQRLMFLMKHEQGLTCEEIGQAMGTSVGTVKKTLFRVVSKLREQFVTVPNKLKVKEEQCMVAKVSEQA